MNLRIKFLSISILLSALALAQAPPFVSESYPFVNAEANHIQFFGSDAPFSQFYTKMEKMMLSGKGNINIVHIGGSHLQADVWSERARNNFQNLMPFAAGSRGLVFPYKIAKTNGPYAYSIEHGGNWQSCRNVLKDRDCELGMTGISVSTTDTAAFIRIVFREEQPSSYYHTSFKVFHTVNDSSFELRPFIAEGFTLRKDTIEGFTEIIFTEPRDTFEIEIIRTQENQNHFTLTGILLENKEAGFIYHNIGVNGASVPSYIRCPKLPSQLKHLKPDLIIFSVGINDANDPDFSEKDYELNYDTLIAMIKSVAPDATILFTTNTDSYYKKKHPNKNGLKVHEAMTRLSKKYDAGVWDLMGVMGGLGSIKKWEGHGMAKKDLIHLTNEGYKIVGDLMFNAIIKSYSDTRAGKP
jgi:lysophospholipase L1-like esterase